jgi:hypothetical protein
MIISVQKKLQIWIISVKIMDFKVRDQRKKPLVNVFSS